MGKRNYKYNLYFICIINFISDIIKISGKSITEEDRFSRSLFAKEIARINYLHLHCNPVTPENERKTNIHTGTPENGVSSTTPIMDTPPPKKKKKIQWTKRKKKCLLEQKFFQLKIDLSNYKFV
jgi:hypothetical protein